MFWFGLREQYALPSKRLWRRAVAEGATDRDPVAVHKHFDHLVKYPGGMRRLLDNLKRRGRVPPLWQLSAATVQRIAKSAMRGSRRAWWTT